MAQSEYKDINNNDWNNLRQALRRANERLSNLEGYSGTSNKYSSTDMRGNQILSGPNPQVTAKEDEFITKSYLRSQEVSAIFQNNLKSGGQGQIATTLPVAQAERPLFGIITPGTPEAFMDNFSDETLWTPTYGHGTGTDDPLLSFQPSGSFTIVKTGDFTVSNHQMVGVRSRFQLFPSSAGIIQYRVKITSMSYNTSYSTDMQWGFGTAHEGLAATGYNMGGGGGLGMNWSYGRIRLMAGSANLISERAAGTLFYTQSGAGQVSTSGMAAAHDVRVTIKHKTSGSDLYSYSMETIEWKLAGSTTYTTVALGTQAVSFANPINGLPMFVGLLSDRATEFTGVMEEIELLQGTARFRYV